MLCRHPHADAVVDATQFWAPKPVNRAAGALCSQPDRIRRAMQGCLDLWGRAADAGTAVEVDDDLPLLLRQHPEAFRAKALNRVHELSVDG